MISVLPIISVHFVMFGNGSFFLISVVYIVRVFSLCFASFVIYVVLMSMI